MKTTTQLPNCPIAHNFLVIKNKIKINDIANPLQIKKEPLIKMTLQQMWRR